MYGDTTMVETLTAARDRARADYEQIKANGNPTQEIGSRMRMWEAEDAHMRAEMISDITGGLGRDNDGDLPWSAKATAWVIGEKAMQAADQEAAGFQELISDAQSAGWEDVVDLEEVEPGVYAVDQDEAGL
jgi:hypothetical protein